MAADTSTGKPLLRRSSDAPAPVGNSTMHHISSENVSRQDAINHLENALWYLRAESVWKQAHILPENVKFHITQKIDAALSYLQNQKPTTPT